MHRFLDHYGLPVTLTFDPAIFSERTAKHVLVFPFYQNKLLFTIHTERGIELPGGKVEPGETSIAAAIRETYEETGYCLSAIRKIGQYTVGDAIVKDIYVAQVERQLQEMVHDNVGGCLLLDVPETLKTDDKFSPTLRDDVYPLTLAYLREHGLA
ncbi:NUDIX domain-containing protein [Brevibacillus fluminis]|uniref:NUDIX domain-containing protein n=1 Tax=Brevibacillus fluminis TaxID=511487 RepID=A0A3M8DSL9_9BACL|nr:NUDIX domain-containing protein [Brevibacillus fluminis]RNB91160.1 NUDIX domain-containing protein [Brevibacillus fluminis]